MKPSDTPRFKQALNRKGCVLLQQKSVPIDIAQSVDLYTCENAGIAYRSDKIHTGKDQAEDRWIKEPMITFPKLRTLQMSEEKYRFTPDQFKAATRAQRVKDDLHSIAHLRESQAIISEAAFSKSSATTSHGKALLSTYLPANAHKLDIKRYCKIICDSELILQS